MRHRSPRGATPMSTLTALKLERELEIARLAMATAAEQPKLVCRWMLDAETGRPVAVWMQQGVGHGPAVVPEPAFAQ
jgi:hypothetical protein